MVKQKVLNIQLGSIYDAEKKKTVPVIIPAYPKKDKKGNIYYQATIRIFVNEMEVKSEKEKEEAEL